MSHTVIYGKNIGHLYALVSYSYLSLTYLNVMQQ